jgi:hypothetical protein
VKVVVVGIPGATSLRLPSWSVFGPLREMVYHGGLHSREGGTLTWVVRTKGNKILLVGNIARIINWEIIRYNLGLKHLCVHFLGWSSYMNMLGWNDYMTLGYRDYRLIKG